MTTIKNEGSKKRKVKAAVSVPVVPLVKPEKKKELEAFWSSIKLDNIHLLTEEDYGCYRRWVNKKEKRQDQA